MNKKVSLESKNYIRDLLIGGLSSVTSLIVAYFMFQGQLKQSDADMVQTLYAQVQFLLAEAANELIIPGGIAQAKIHYVNGITASFAFNGLPAPSTAYLSGVDFTTQAAGRTQIGTQVWLALYGQGIEAWTEWRRTGVPLFSTGPGIGNSNVIPLRYQYPSSEIATNKDNYTAAVASQYGGKDDINAQMWIIK